ncbi:hypothetical protein ONS96_004734 [Cadophora gregata f. sp. sojae]|nr:hypothetical protein ONS96_004734 [Cadophora gregata f. sp. sojae]
MTSLLWSTHEVTTETPLPASATLSSALALLHDHAAFQSQQPLATHNEPISTPPKDSFLATKALSFCPEGTEPEYRSVTIEVPMAFLGANTFITHSAFVNTEDGMIVVFQAPMSLNGWSRWSVVKTENEGDAGLLLREQATLTGLRFLMPFVVGTEKKSHKDFQLNFAKRLESDVDESATGT